MVDAARSGPVRWGVMAAIAANKIAPAMLAGICGISLPSGFTTNPKLPIGLQLLGKPFGEETLLKIAHAYEQSTPWHKERVKI